MSVILSGIEMVGVIAFAASGALTAIQKQLDIFGIMILSIITAMGGGTIRDIFLGNTPPKMFENGTAIVLSITVAVILFAVYQYSHKWRKRLAAQIEPIFIFCDALGLGIFSAIGTDMGISSGYSGNLVLCLFLGSITGVGGGMLRDMMCADIPAVLCRNIYAVAAIAGSGMFYLTSCLGLGRIMSTLIAIFITVTCRLLAWHYRWNLPKVSKNQLS